MADISSHITNIQEAVYGKDVRSSFVSALTAINNDYNTILAQYSSFSANMAYLMELAEKLEGKKILDVE